MEVKLKIAMRGFIIHNNKVLLIRESENYDSPNKGKYDLPGGKINPGENFKEGLLREIKEECGLNVKIGKAFSVQEWRPIVKETIHHIIGTFIKCSVDNPEVKLSKDHDKYIWIDPKDYEKYNLIESTFNAFKDYNEN